MRYTRTSHLNALIMKSAEIYLMGARVDLVKPLSLTSMSQSQGTRATKPILTSAKPINYPTIK